MPCDGLEHCPNGGRVEDAPCNAGIDFLTPKEIEDRVWEKLAQILASDEARLKLYTSGLNKSN